MALTIDQFGNLGLSAGQKSKLTAAGVIGDTLRQMRSPRPGQDVPVLDLSPVTLAQAKAIDNFIRDVNTLLGPMQEAAKYIIQKNKDDAAASADAGTPAGTL